MTGFNIVGVPYDIFEKPGEEFQSESRAAVEWLRSLGVSTSADRYHKYISQLDYKGSSRKQDENSAFRDYLNAHGELHDLVRVWKSLLSLDSVQYVDTLKKVTSGQAYRNVAAQDPARDFLFELSVASRLIAAGYEVSLNQIADIVAHVDGRKLYVEAKRVRSLDKLPKRVADANKQIKLRLAQDKSSRSRGMVAVNLTDIINAGSKIGVAPDASVLQREHSQQLNDFLVRNVASIEKGMANNCLGVLAEYTLHGVIHSDFEVDPRAVIFNCRGATFRPYEKILASSDRTFISDVLPKLANQRL
ncbi:hypothetical protein KSS94_18050 [Pseudomonas fakonensis]|uniref:Uncharacterized protein n=1 Tax=Pseudomonas fakonensis TaxID=2842355 RepID=A0ABX8N0E3_9PSED|nr:hypothetical protein [Pseudomonas fakonensis]QXH49838.1 hypothetical protein KSS94_18050 [Pseudomonas fakonensis]